MARPEELNEEPSLKEDLERGLIRTARYPKELAADLAEQLTTFFEGNIGALAGDEGEGFRFYVVLDQSSSRDEKPYRFKLSFLFAENKTEIDGCALDPRSDEPITDSGYIGRGGAMCHNFQKRVESIETSMGVDGYEALYLTLEGGHYLSIARDLKNQRMNCLFVIQ